MHRIVPRRIAPLAAAALLATLLLPGCSNDTVDGPRAVLTIEILTPDSGGTSGAGFNGGVVGFSDWQFDLQAGAEFADIRLHVEPLTGDAEMLLSFDAALSEGYAGLPESITVDPPLTGSNTVQLEDFDPDFFEMTISTSEPLTEPGSLVFRYRVEDRHTVLAGKITISVREDIRLPGGGSLEVPSPTDDWALGRVIAGAGDVNSDGFADALVATGDETTAGEVFLVLGHDGLSDLDELDLIDVMSSPDAVRLDGISTGDDAGARATGVGDVNGDGHDDIVIASPDADPDGKAFIVFGHADIGLDATIKLQLLGDGGVTLTPATTAEAGFARNVAGAGDINGDGYADVLISGPDDPGDVYVVFGRASLPEDMELPTDLTSADGLRITGLDVFTPTGDGEDTISGAGDANGDGFDDLLIGQPDAGDGGEVLLIYGAGTLGSNGVWDLGVDFGAGTGEHIIAAAVADRLGAEVAAAGDVNGDGYHDILLGAPTASGQGSQAGIAYLLFGGEAMSGDGTIELADLDAEAGVRITSYATLELPRSLGGAGDLNGDGFGDVALGATGDGGHAVVLFGGEAFGGESGVIALSEPLQPGTGVHWISRQNGAGLAYVSAAGDLDGDSYGDLLVGDPLATGDPSGMGEAWVAFGRPEGTTVPEATARVWHRAGDAPMRGVGLVGTGVVAGTPATRAWVDWSTGHGPLTDTSPSLTTVSVRRQLTGVALLPAATHYGNVVWTISSDRVDTDEMAVVLTYLDRDIPTITNPGGMAVYRSATGSGGWSPVFATVNTERRAITFTSEPGVFILAE